MSAPRLVDQIDIHTALKFGLNLEGELALGDLPRLLAKSYEPQGSVNYKIQIHQGIDSLVRLTLHATVKLTLQCQRCLKPMPYSFETSSELVPVYKLEDAKNLDPQYEPLDLTTGPITYQDLLEDECILALPQIALHKADECTVKIPEAPPEPKRQNPFEVLKKS